MKVFIALLLMFTNHALSAQQQVGLKDVKDFIGKNVSLEITITDTKYLSDKEMTFLNAGRFPHHKFSIIIKGENRYKFSEAPELLFKGRNVIITGKVEIYKGVPQIVVTDKQQLIIAYKG